MFKRAILGLRPIHPTAWCKFMGLLLKTGQTTQYSSKEDDGYFQKGLSRDYTVLTTGQYSGTTNITLNSKTHALSNECVMDNRTGLMWARYVPDADIGPDDNGKLLWVDDVNDEDIFDFKDQANTEKLGGHADWRVSNIFEAISLLVLEGAAPYIDPTAFPSATNGAYWSSTTSPGTTANAMYYSLDVGGFWEGGKAATKNYCRLVRG